MALRKIIRIDEALCDGCGLCVPSCAEDAIQIIDGKARLVGETLCDGLGACLGECPRAALTIEERDAEEFDQSAAQAQPATGSALSHWPVKLQLVPPRAPFLDGADLVLAADCVPFALNQFHSQILSGRSVVIGCPKFDEYEPALARLTEILKQSKITSLTVVHMEVPCCFGYLRLAQEALAASGMDIPLREEVVGVRGDLRGAAACAGT